MKSKQARLEEKKKRRRERNCKAVETSPSISLLTITEFDGGLLQVVEPFVVTVKTYANEYCEWDWKGVVAGGCPDGTAIRSHVYRSLILCLTNNLLVDNHLLQKHVHRSLDAE